ncbi:putative thioredoxin [Vibrio phage 193E37-1]|nr:putative thioredoxin [Vibrio phage 193E37-1]
MNENKLKCPECDTRQVQLVGYIDITPAQWKCRKCKHKFEWEK